MTYEDLEMFLYYLDLYSESLPVSELKKTEDLIVKSDLFTDRDYTEGDIK